jgi:outer membrane usher protein
VLGTILSGQANPVQAAVARGTTTPRDELLLLVVEINEQTSSEAIPILRSEQKGLCASATQWLAWRLRLPQIEPIFFGGDTYFPISAIDQVKLALDEAGQSLRILAPAEAFEATKFRQAQRPRALTESSPAGGFLNYDLITQHLTGSAPGRTSGLFEIGAFGGDHGVLIASALAQGARAGQEFVRLDTTWTQDAPEKRTTWRIGDAITHPAASWGRSVRFGGIQFGSNALTQPYFNPAPLQTISGEAVLPSTVDVFLNNKIISSKEVPPGPFSLTQLTTVGGGASMQVVVRDPLGRERVMSHPFYASPSLLAKGFSDFSIEAGQTRMNYGLISADYGRGFAAGTWRRGMSDQVTAEVHAEVAQGGQVTAGLNATKLAPRLGLLNLAGAISRGESGVGQWGAVGFERNLIGKMGFGVSTQRASAAFTQLGLANGELPPRSLSTGSINFSTVPWGSVNVSLIHRESQARERAALLSANYSVNVFQKSTLNVSWVNTLSASSTRSLFVLLTIPLDRQVSSSIAAQRNSNDSLRQTEFATQAQRNLPAGEGLGGQVRVTDRGTQEVGGVAQTDRFTARFDLVRSPQNKLASRGMLSGGIAFLDGSTYLTRRITDSFAVVSIPDYPGVRVFADNQLVGKTDASGTAFLPRLRAYEFNRIGINQTDLPLDAKVDAVTVNATPGYRSGVVVKFPVGRARGGLIQILLDDGMPLPAGAIVTRDGNPETFPVAMNGAVYLTGLDQENEIEAHWRDQTCRIHLRAPASADPVPNYGALRCAGVAR